MTAVVLHGNPQGEVSHDLLVNLADETRDRRVHNAEPGSQTAKKPGWRWVGQRWFPACVVFPSLGNLAVY